MHALEIQTSISDQTPVEPKLRNPISTASRTSKPCTQQTHKISPSSSPTKPQISGTHVSGKKERSREAAIVAVRRRNSLRNTVHRVASTILIQRHHFHRRTPASLHQARPPHISHHQLDHCLTSSRARRCCPSLVFSPLFPLILDKGRSKKKKGSLLQLG